MFVQLMPEITQIFEWSLVRADCANTVSFSVSLQAGGSFMKVAETFRRNYRIFFVHFHLKNKPLIR